ncbi:MAG: cytochrome c oxidase accessory protein CcoG [Burkholderiaceae bacterium]
METIEAKRGQDQAASAPKAPAAVQEVEIALYAKRKEIYPRQKIGDSIAFFQKWRWALVWLTQIVFYGLPWLSWNGRQAVLFDLAARKFYIFGLMLWPQDIIYLTALLIIAAMSLFLFTAVGGRLWCGFACPQTVYTEIFMWIERLIEGDRAKRMALDRQPASLRKAALKLAKHATWIALALWTGYTFVGFFTPIRELGIEVITWQVGGWSLFWILFYGLATYGNAGWMREQVCKYMCPYARFQSAMFDPDTLIISYDTERGEPRGAGGKALDRKGKGLGDCVDCGLCVQVCPTGIDIRNGLQYECIGCSACIDACDFVMDKVGSPRGLIRYSTENALAKHYGRQGILAHILRPRVMIYTAILSAVVAALAIALWVRVPVKLDIIRDRGALASEGEDGRIVNTYRLQVINTTEQPREFMLSADGLPGLKIETADRFAVPAATTFAVPLRLSVPPEGLAPGSNKIVVEVKAADDGSVAVREKTVFLNLPR